jgi:alkaline phosphatase
MNSLLTNFKRSLAFVMACSILVSTLVLDSPAIAAPNNGVNVIIMIGDGMGWNMARAAAIAKGGPTYTAGKGSGLAFQTLTGYGQVTTYGTTIQASATGAKLTGNTALDGTNGTTGGSPVRAGFVFDPTINSGARFDGNSTAVGNIAGYEANRGGPLPWIPLSPANSGSYDRDYIKYSYPDSANTATTLYTGVKSYNNAMGVDVYEKKLTTIQEIATQQGKSTGIVSSVPLTHATPGAAVSFVNRRNKYDSDFDPAKTNQDSILQQALLTFKPTVFLGGGHPLDHVNATNVGPVCNYVYIRATTYKELTGKGALSDAAACSAPTSTNAANRYGYTFLERGPNAAAALLAASNSVNPNTGGRLLGLYGARGQDGDIPFSSSRGDYSLTGLGNFTLYSSVVRTAATAAACASGRYIPGSTNECVPVLDGNGNPTTPAPAPDTVRPLAPGETDAQFIAREVNENPTLADMTQAALNVLGKDKDGFWLMVEGGDIDWGAHDNNMDGLIGAVNDFDIAVQTTINWINKNGGFSKNLLIVTADHDHYLTLNPDFASKLTAQNPSTSRGLKFNAKDITFNRQNPREAGHFFGSDPTQKYNWGNHSKRVVPVYYQGVGSDALTRFLGQDVKFTDSTGASYTVPGVRGVVDQTQIFLAMKAALTK